LRLEWSRPAGAGLAGANDNPNTLINATFVSPDDLAEVAAADDDRNDHQPGNQVRVFKSVAGCSPVAQTNNGSNNVFVIS
jgi:hypothetical protein